MTFTQARKELAARVARVGSQVEVAKTIGCTKSHLSHVLVGRKTFGLRFALKIESEYQIPSSAWFTRRVRTA